MGRATGLIGILIVLLTTQSIGQGLVTGADIRGTVRDASGVVMYDASVVATNVETGISRPARTDRDGRYTLTGLATRVLSSFSGVHVVCDAGS